jgi:hypothetical protein
MTFAQSTRFALCFILFGQALGAQGKPPAKPEPNKTPPVVVSTPGAVSNAMRAPIKLDGVRFFTQQPYLGGGTRSSRDGRYVALNRPTIAVEFSNQSGTTQILRGYVIGYLYKGSPPERPAVSVRPAGPAPTVQEMFDNMARYALPQYSTRMGLSGNLEAGQLGTTDNRLFNALDSVPSMQYNDAKWTPRQTVIVEVGVPYTARVDFAHELDGTTRFYRADLTFRFDSSGRMIGAVLSHPPPPPPTTTRPTVEVRR